MTITSKNFDDDIPSLHDVLHKHRTCIPYQGLRDPGGKPYREGTAIVNLLQLQPGEKITAVIPIREYTEGHFLFMATKKGIVKKTPITDYANVRKTGLAAISLREDDELIEVKRQITIRMFS